MWFAAHVIMRYHFLDTNTGSLEGYENVIIVNADNPTEAFDRARSIAKEDEIRGDGHYLDDRPVALLVAGVRKVVECRLTPGDRTFSEGSEITYNDIQADTVSEFDAFVQGEPVRIRVE